MSNYIVIMFRKDAIYLITRVYYKLNRFLAKELVANDINGFVPSHGEIIGTLFIKGKLQMKDLPELIDKDKSTVTALVKKLIGMGFIKKEKDKDDNRISYISLTENGKVLNPVLDKILKGLNGKAYLGLSESERMQLVKLLTKVFNNF